MLFDKFSDMNDDTKIWIIAFFKKMYDMSQDEDWDESMAQALIMDGGDFYMDHFMNWN